MCPPSCPRLPLPVVRMTISNQQWWKRMQAHVPLYPCLHQQLLPDFLITFYYILRSISGSGYISSPIKRCCVTSYCFQLLWGKTEYSLKNFRLHHVTTLVSSTGPVVKPLDIAVKMCVALGFLAFKPSAAWIFICLNAVEFGPTLPPYIKTPGTSHGWYDANSCIE